MPTLEDRALRWLVLLATIAFAAILWPFSGAILWGVVLAILFAPLQRRIAARLHGRRGLAAVCSLAVVGVMVVLPLALVGASLVNQGAALARRLRDSPPDYAGWFGQAMDALPEWIVRRLQQADLADLGAVRERLTEALQAGSQQLATKLLDYGQNTFDLVLGLFLALYLLFFLLRDGDALAAILQRALPLRPAQQQALIERLVVAVRATIKGSVIVAAVQGVLGGMIFWMLGVGSAPFWGMLMALASLLPAIGPALVWVPAAIWLLVTAPLWKGLVLIGFGAFVIGLVDNLLRPLIVGKDLELPDWLVLLATLGAIFTLGVNGFLLGPMLAALFVVAWNLFAREREAANR